MSRLNPIANSEDETEQWDLTNDLPDTLDFHLPRGIKRKFWSVDEGKVLTELADASGPVDLNFDDEIILHRQLTCWCLIQRFWYYVLSDPQVSDQCYDFIEHHVKKLETMSPDLRKMNPHSPTKEVGSNRYDHYPRSIIGFFANHEPFKEHVNSVGLRLRAWWRNNSALSSVTAEIERPRRKKK